MDKKDFAEELIRIFPEKAEALATHYKDYGELLAHIFFAEEINVPLFELLINNQNKEIIREYCDFIEKMWLFGTEDVKNVVNVTILERLSDDKDVWMRFGTQISDKFKQDINEYILKENAMMWNTPKL